MDFENVKTIENFDKWTEALHKAVHISKKMGMKEDTITDIAKKVGDFLADNVDPENPKQRILKELWEVGNDEERHILAHLVVKLIETKYHNVD
ncbi:MAG: hypothetical protein K0Q49_2164 [Haloplasmataceae bacterium]|jgi:hypothetical protein|nr:hypothetical protein [Haloplasmataceae bacterium]